MDQHTTPLEEFERTPRWLSHHHHGEADRCVRVGNRFVCRRCLVLHPTVVVVAAVVAVADVSGSPLTAAATTLLLLPFLVEWSGDHLGLFAYSPRRSASVSALAAVGLGLALGIHVRYPFDPLAVVPVAAVAAVSAATVVIGKVRGVRDDNGSASWENTFLAEETRRRRRLESMLEAIEAADD